MDLIDETSRHHLERDGSRTERWRSVAMQARYHDCSVADDMPGRSRAVGDEQVGSLLTG